MSHSTITTEMEGNKLHINDQGQVQDYKRMKMQTQPVKENRLDQRT